MKIASALKSKTTMQEEASGEMKQKDFQAVEMEQKMQLLEEERERAVEQSENLRKELFSCKDDLKKKVN